MENVSEIGVELAKSVFKLHGAAADGSVVFRKKLSRAVPIVHGAPSSLSGRYGVLCPLKTGSFRAEVFR